MAIIKRPDLYQCDLCKHESEDVNDTRRVVGGSLKITWQGSESGRTIQGDWGGRNLNGSAWLCYDCMKKFTEFMGV